MRRKLREYLGHNWTVVDIVLALSNKVTADIKAIEKYYRNSGLMSSLLTRIHIYTQKDERLRVIMHRYLGYILRNIRELLKLGREADLQLRLMASQLSVTQDAVLVKHESTIVKLAKLNHRILNVFWTSTAVSTAKHQLDLLESMLRPAHEAREHMQSCLRTLETIEQQTINLMRLIENPLTQITSYGGDATEFLDAISTNARMLGAMSAKHKSHVLEGSRLADENDGRHVEPPQ